MAWDRSFLVEGGLLEWEGGGESLAVHREVIKDGLWGEGFLRVWRLLVVLVA